MTTVMAQHPASLSFGWNADQASGVIAYPQRVEP
jgi:hypothetical protein